MTRQVNRLGDNVLVFDVLRPEFTEGICKKFLCLLADSARERVGISIEFPDGSIQEMIHREMGTERNLLFGGRRIKSLLETLVELPLNQWVFFNSPQAGSRLNLTADPESRTLMVNGSRVDDV